MLGVISFMHKPSTWTDEKHRPDGSEQSRPQETDGFGSIRVSTRPTFAEGRR
jgi:hypothetical protein